MAVPTLIVNDTTPEGHHGCTRVMRTLRMLCAAHDLQVIGTVPVHQSWREAPAISELLERARLVIVNGEGSIHHGSEQAGALLSIAGAARARGIPAVLLNASWQANPPHFVGLASAFAVIAVRESMSQGELARHGVSARLMPDLSLYTPHRGASTAHRHGVLFTDSVVTSTAAALTRKRIELGAEEISLFEPARQGNLVWKTRMAAARARETPITKRLAAFTANWPSGRTAEDDRTLIHQIAATQLMVTGRFHAACFALLSETALLCIPSNTHKIDGLSRDAGIASWRLTDVARIDAQLVAAASSLSSEEKENITSYLEVGRLAVRRLFSDIKRLC